MSAGKKNRVLGGIPPLTKKSSAPPTARQIFSERIDSFNKKRPITGQSFYDLFPKPNDPLKKKRPTTGQLFYDLFPKPNDPLNKKRPPHKKSKPTNLPSKIPTDAQKYAAEALFDLTSPIPLKYKYPLGHRLSRA